MEPFEREQIERIADEIPFVSRVVYLPSVGSTNQVLKEMAGSGAPEGSVVVADEQTSGRGRLKRSWIAPAGSSLLFSVLLRPSLPAYQSPTLVMVCSLAIRDAIREVTGVQIALKWPNDLVYHGRKLGGILAETASQEDRIAWAVVGMGINVNWDPSAVEGLAQPATSLSNIAGSEVDRLPLLRAILSAIGERYAALKGGHVPSQEWESALETIGQLVTAVRPAGPIEGTAVGVDSDGALLIRTASGTVERVVAGDVSLRPRATSDRSPQS